MSHPFHMPDIGEGLTEAEIVVWLASVGDTITVGQPVVEVETAKTTVEIPATHGGVLVSLHGEAGDIVEVGDVLFVIGVGDEDGQAAATRRAADHAGSDDQRASDDQAGSGGEASPEPPAPAPSDRSTAEVKAMPAVRRLAGELGVDLTTVAASGPGGSITRADVERAASGGTEDREPLSATRRAIAAHMAESWRTIPHVTVQAEIRAERLLARRGTGDGALPLEAVIAESILPLLYRYPWFNAAYDDGEVVVNRDVHLGFAVDTDAGLLVVVVDGAAHRSTSEIGVEFRRLAEAARDRTIGPDDVTGQTFTISNIGALGGGHGTPIIPIGTSAILSIGRATEQAVVEDGALTIGLVAPIDLSYDHRLIDGGLGQRFLADLVAALEA